MTQPTLNLIGIFVRKVHLDTEHLPFELEGEFNYQVNVGHGHRALPTANHYAVAATVKLTATVAGKPVTAGEFVIEIVAEAKDFDEGSLQNVLNIFLPNQVIPYVRELVSNLTMRTGFVPMLLPPLFIQPVPTPAAEGHAQLPANYGPKSLH